MSTIPKTDWRREFVVCQHVADLDAKGDPKGPKTDGLRHHRFDVCCQECADKGFLGNDDLALTNLPNGLCVGAFK